MQDQLTIAIIIALTVLTLTLAYILLTRPQGSGCGGGHHWSDDSPKDQWRIKSSYFGNGAYSFAVQREFEKSCRHEGCDNHRTQWRTVGSAESIDGAYEKMIEHIETERENND